MLSITPDILKGLKKSFSKVHGKRRDTEQNDMEICCVKTENKKRACVILIPTATSSP